MDWATPDIEQFLSFENANELVLQYLWHITVACALFHQNHKKQVAALCGGKSTNMSPMHSYFMRVEI